jgi:hypothetical protein
MIPTGHGTFGSFTGSTSLIAIACDRPHEAYSATS